MQVPIDIVPMRFQHLKACSDLALELLGTNREYSDWSQFMQYNSEHQIVFDFDTSYGSIAVLHRSLVIGYALFECDHGDLELIEIVIESNRQRCGIGSQVMKWFLDQTPAGKVFRVCVDEQDLDTQMFLKACGIRCVATITADEDEQYLFQFPNDMEV